MVRVFAFPIVLQGTWWLFPIAMVLACTGIGLCLEKFQIVRGYYASPYVMIVAWSALRAGRMGGLLAAALSGLIWNVVFVTPSGIHWPTNEELLAYLSMVGAAWIVGGYRPHSGERVVLRYAGSLPFVRSARANDDQKERCFWDVLPTGSWSFDTSVGEEYARIYLERCKTYGAPALGWVVRDMIRSGSYTGIEAGFVGGLAAALPIRQRVSMPVVCDANSTDDDT